MPNENQYNDINEEQAWNIVVTDEPDEQTLTFLAVAPVAQTTTFPDTGADYHSFAFYSSKPIYWSLTSLVAVNDPNSLKCHRFEGGRFGLGVKTGFKQIFFKPITTPAASFEVSVMVG